MVTATDKSARTQLREWLDNEIAHADEVKLPDLANTALEHFSRDTRFLRDFLKENLRDVLYLEAQRFIATTRNHVLLGSTITTRSGFQATARRKSVFENWFEHVNDRHIHVLDMSKTDLLAASTERRERGEREITLANLWRSLADKLDPKQHVRDVFTAEEIETVFNQLNS
jgi:hypothetical protein